MNRRRERSTSEEFKKSWMLFRKFLRFVFLFPLSGTFDKRGKRVQDECISAIDDK